MKTTFTFITLLLLSTCSWASTVIINWSITSDPIRTLDDRFSNPLNAGANTAGDGTLLQLGYYDQATLANPFSGNWITLASTTMGDDGLELPGKFSTSTVLGVLPFSAPSVGMPLAVKFFDGTSVENSSYFNVVSNKSGAWNFIAPSDPAPVINIVIDKSTSIVFQSVGGAFQTQIAIPEPSSLFLASVALSFSMLNRRRQKK